MLSLTAHNEGTCEQMMLCCRPTRSTCTEPDRSSSWYAATSHSFAVHTHRQKHTDQDHVLQLVHGRLNLRSTVYHIQHQLVIPPSARHQSSGCHGALNTAGDTMGSPSATSPLFPLEVCCQQQLDAHQPSVVHRSALSSSSSSWPLLPSRWSSSSGT